MAAKRITGAGPRRRGEPGTPSRRRGPDPAEVAEGYVDDELRSEEAELVEDAAAADEEFPSGTTVDQLVYEGLAENRFAAEPADPKARSRRRSPLDERTAPGKRAPKRAPGREKPRGGSKR